MFQPQQIRIAALYIYDGANADIHDNRISIGATAGKTGVGVQVGRSASPNSGTYGTATIWNNEIVNFATYGVAVEHDTFVNGLTASEWTVGSYAEIHHNVIDGSGVPAVGQQAGIHVYQ